MFTLPACFRSCALLVLITSSCFWSFSVEDDARVSSNVEVDGFDMRVDVIEDNLDTNISCTRQAENSRAVSITWSITPTLSFGRWQCCLNNCLHNPPLPAPPRRTRRLRLCDTGCEGEDDNILCFRVCGSLQIARLNSSKTGSWPYWHQIDTL